MPDFNLIHKAALADVRYGTFGNMPPEGPGIRLQACPETCLLHVLGAPGCGDLFTDLTANPACHVRVAGPSQWLIASEDPITDAVIRDLESLLGERAVISDQTHGRIRIGISGPRASALLAKGTAIDLDPAQFRTGKSAMTLIGHITVNLARIGHDAFEIIVLRGFAESLWNDLIHMGLEYGIDCIPAHLAGKHPSGKISG